jgi:hypothetical protein
MKLKELVNICTWEEVKTVLPILYPENEKSLESFEVAFNCLKQKEPIESNIKIRLYKHTDNWFQEEEEEKDFFIAVDCIDPEDKDKLYGLTYPWKKSLGMDIFLDDGLKLSNIEIMVHCLWEMTCFGFTEEQIKSFLDGLGKYNNTYYTSRMVFRDTPERLKDEISSTVEHLLMYKGVNGLTKDDLSYLLNAQDFREISIYPFNDDWVSDFISYFKQEFYSEDEEDLIFNDIPFKDCSTFSLFIYHSTLFEIKEEDMSSLKDCFSHLFPKAEIKIFKGATDKENIGLGRNGEKIEVSVIGSI